MTPGQAADSRQAPTLLVGRRPGKVLADRAYDTATVRACIAALDSEAVIPPTASRCSPYPYDAWIYQARSAVEQLINKLKHFRSFATRYEKTARNYTSMAVLAFIALWLRL